MRILTSVDGARIRPRRELEPTARELALIEAEWPSIEADMVALDGEIRALTSADAVDELDVRRVRRARRVALRAVVVRPSLGGEAA